MRQRVRILFRSVLCLLLLDVGCRTSYAGFMMFTDSQSFFQAAQVVSTETFDEIPSRTIIGVGSVSLDGITYTSADPSAQWFTSNSFVSVSPPNQLTQRNVLAPATLTFAGGGQTDAVGFYLEPGSSIPGGLYRFDLTSPFGGSFTATTGVIAAAVFRGFTSSDGISSLTVTPLNVPGGVSNFDLDNVSRGAITSVIPEPSSLTLGTTGILVLLATTWWQRMQRPTIWRA